MFCNLVPILYMAIVFVVTTSPAPTRVAPAITNSTQQVIRFTADPQVEDENGFSFKNMSFKKDNLYSFDMIGEVTNSTVYNYKTVYFTISFYNKKDVLLDVKNFNVDNLKAYGTKSFGCTLRSDINVREISRYKIQFDSGY